MCETGQYGIGPGELERTLLMERNADRLLGDEVSIKSNLSMRRTRPPRVRCYRTAVPSRRRRTREAVTKSHCGRAIRDLCGTRTNAETIWCKAKKKKMPFPKCRKLYLAPDSTGIRPRIHIGHLI